MYCSQADITNIVDAVNLQAALDDYAQGSFQSAQLNNIIAMASNKCDALVSSIYQTPFASPPAKIKDACIIFSAFAIFQRRLTPTERNPYAEQQNYWVDMLTKVGAGELPLDANFPREFVPLVYSAHKTRVDTNFY